MSKPNPLWQFFCSVKLTIVLLLALALTSIIGTLIPQNENPELYLNAYGAFWYQFFSILGFFDLYRSWWFQGLMLLLCINIVVCSVDRLSGNWKVIFTRNPKVNPERFTRRTDARVTNDKRDVDELLKVYEPLIAGRFGYCRVIRSNGSAVIYGEKGRLSRLGVYIVHLSVVLLLIGGLVGSFFGFQGFVNIPEGESTDTIRLRSTGQLHRLDFEIRCDSFSMERWDSGTPKEYRSSLTILKGGAAVKQKDIVVNDPLRYRGINIFQSSYGTLPPDRMPRAETPPPGPADAYTLAFTSPASGMNYTLTASVGVPLDIPEGLGKFVVIAYDPEVTFRGMDIGPALQGILTPADGEPVEVLLPLNFANFDKMRGGDVIISVVNPPSEGAPQQPPGERYYTGLQVTRDPGVGLVYTGFVLMIAGVLVSFYLSHQQVCIVIEELRKNRRVTVAGIANRNKLAMQKLNEKLFQAMSRV